MVRRKSIWIAETDDKKWYATKGEAYAAELESKERKEIDKLEPIFRKYFKKDYGKKDRYNSYLYLCVGCGKKILEYDSVWDGHRSNRGEVLFRDSDATKLFNGWICSKCHDKIVKLIQEMIALYNNDKNTLLVIDLRFWKEIYVCYSKDKKMLLQLSRMVEYYHKSKKKK